uniref:2-dehydropantoate 2-reductase n=1 Tax=Angomonas desouzai TaxID=59800 RepID=T1YSP4_9TRYP|nr:2-dehydropantoate 2-reductase [Angomonas desouzai]
MHITNFYVVGLGALGTMYATQLAHYVEESKVPTSLKVIVDAGRKERYLKEGVYCNEEEVKLSYVTPGEIEQEEADAKEHAFDPESLTVFMICTKHHHLKQVMEELLPSFVRYHRQQGPVVLFAVTNGIESEGLLAEKFGKENVLYSMAQSAAYRQSSDSGEEGKKGFRTSYSFAGKAHRGEEKEGEPTPRLTCIAELLNRAGIDCVVQAQIKRVMWSKLMFNCGVNQVLAVFLSTYGDLQTGKKEIPDGVTPEDIPSLLSQLTDDPAQLQALRAEKPWVQHQLYIAAMKEVIAISQHEPLYTDGGERIALTEADIDYYEDMVKGLVPTYAPSMKMDMAAGRKTEVEVFAGTIMQWGAKYGVPVPVNTKLFEVAVSLERRYGAA